MEEEAYTVQTSLLQQSKKKKNHFMIDSLSNHTNKYIFLFTDKSGRFTQNKCIPMKSGIMNPPHTRAQIVDL